MGRVWVGAGIPRSKDPGRLGQISAMRQAPYRSSAPERRVFCLRRFAFPSSPIWVLAYWATGAKNTAEFPGAPRRQGGARLGSGDFSDPPQSVAPSDAPRRVFLHAAVSHLPFPLLGFWGKGGARSRIIGGSGRIVRGTADLMEGMVILIAPPPPPHHQPTHQDPMRSVDPRGVFRPMRFRVPTSSLVFWEWWPGSRYIREVGMAYPKCDGSHRRWAEFRHYVAPFSAPRRSGAPFVFGGFAFPFSPFGRRGFRRRNFRVSWANPS